MANRYQSDDQWRRDRLRRGYGRQEEQFQSDRGFNDDPEYGQMGEGWRSSYGEQQSGWADPDHRGDYDRSYAVGTERFGGGFGSERYSRSQRNRFGVSDFASGSGISERNRFDRGRSFGGSPYGAGTQLAANHGEWREGYGVTPSREFRDYRGTWGGGGSATSRDHHERGFLERAGDTLAGWPGDETVRGRNDGYRGRGPANYTRSDERIHEDVCDALTEDRWIDASGIQVTVQNGELTLEGTVPSREQKRRAEDCVDDLSGVKHVQNNLRVQERDDAWDRDNNAEFGSRSNPTSSQE